jgi:hypothetical protein
MIFFKKSQAEGRDWTLAHGEKFNVWFFIGWMIVCPCILFLNKMDNMSSR